MMIWIAINVIILFGAPFFIVRTLWSWAQRQEWTDYPNLHSFIAISIFLIGWVLLSYIMGGVGFTKTEVGPMTLTPGNSWSQLYRGMLIVGILSICFAIGCAVLFFIIFIFRWLFEPRQ